MQQKHAVELSANLLLSGKFIQAARAVKQHGVDEADLERGNGVVNRQGVLT